MSEPGAGSPEKPSAQTRGSEPHLRSRPVRRGWYVLLVLPFAATLVPPFYAREQPAIGGWPFFYWWQFAWVIITALILAFVYRVTTERRPARAAPPGAATPRGPARAEPPGDAADRGGGD